MTPDALRGALAREEAATSDFDLDDRAAPSGADGRAAAVLIAVQDHPGGARILLTKRASHLKHHPGQIALPGGKIEPMDAGPEAAALREAWEEVGLPPGAVRVVGRLSAHRTVTNFTIVPIVGLIEGAFTPRPEVGEVEEVFSVPLSHVLSPANYRVEERDWRGAVRRFYTVPYGPHYIWGATARILRGLADRVASCG